MTELRYARWFCVDPEYTEISAADKVIRDRIVAIIDRCAPQGMDNYGYFDSEDIADAIMIEFGIGEK